MKPRDAASLWDMVEAIKRVQEFIADVSYEEYVDNVLLHSGVERQMEILGEAARRLSNELREEQPNIEWQKIVGLRNIIAHQYDEIQMETIWSIATSELEPLKAKIEPLMPPLPEEP